tara:strand:+ start:1479 stop:1622 length:144 start_codon:yes stop_codon:yes gene_type:complete
LEVATSVVEAELGAMAAGRYAISRGKTGETSALVFTSQANLNNKTCI